MTTVVHTAPSPPRAASAAVHATATARASSMPHSSNVPREATVLIIPISCIQKIHATPHCLGHCQSHVPSKGTHAPSCFLTSHGQSRRSASNNSGGGPIYAVAWVG
eukprot:3728644-Amphidinium_carterae.1